MRILISGETIKKDKAIQVIKRDDPQVLEGLVTLKFQIRLAIVHSDKILWGKIILNHLHKVMSFAIKYFLPTEYKGTLILYKN